MSERLPPKKHSYKCKCIDAGEVRFDVYLPADMEQSDIDNIECPLCKDSVFMSRVGTETADSRWVAELRYYITLILFLASVTFGVPAVLYAAILLTH